MTPPPIAPLLRDVVDGHSATVGDVEIMICEGAATRISAKVVFKYCVLCLHLSVGHQVTDQAEKARNSGHAQSLRNVGNATHIYTETRPDTVSIPEGRLSGRNVEVVVSRFLSSCADNLT